MTYQCTEERFLHDVKDHQMEILRDDGVYRHLRFRRNGTSYTYGFDIITYPGYLVISGDMGSYVFARIKDMFEFFRIDKNDFNFNRAGGLSINTGYWAEKCQAAPKHDGIDEFSSELFEAAVKEHYDSWMEGIDEFDQKEVYHDLWQELEDEVISYADDGEWPAMDAAYRFNHKGFTLCDFWENDVREYTFQYVWILYAIVWGINRYDQATSTDI